MRKVMSSHQNGYKNRKVGDVTRVSLVSVLIANDESHIFLGRREAEIKEC